VLGLDDLGLDGAFDLILKSFAKVLVLKIKHDVYTKQPNPDLDVVLDDKLTYIII
jgi:hypothetical protein